MAENTIDSLVLDISSNSKGAEKALDKLADSLLKMSGALGGMNTSKFMYIAKGVGEISSAMSGFSLNVKMADFNRVVNGLNKIAEIDSAGMRSAAVAMGGLAKGLGNLTFLSFDSKGISELASAIAKFGWQTTIKAAKNIPDLTLALQGLADGLKDLKIDFDIDGLTQLTASIQKLGSKSATKAAETNIVALGKALKEMMKTLSGAPAVSQNIIQMTNALAKLASAGGRVGTASRSLMNSFNTFPSSIAKTRKGFSGLAGAIGKFYATYWLLIRGMSGFRKAIDISSDLTEVQNVVDVTFGDMADTMNRFADSALQNYGMSELMAKKIASRFQSMGVAMGFTQEKMTEMSIQLTKLTGDMASFYNESQESVAKALQSIFTGETEPLRKFGLDLSFATVEAWALAQGIDADMQKMTQAEKTMLRYQYVLANTGAATGDFQRTINSWHNQLVLLAGGFQQLGSIVGGVLINAFKPFIQALNSVMGAIINFAQVVSDALGAIFGWEYQTGGGVAQDLEDGFGAASGIEDAMGGAADNAKKLNKYIAGWHEVNNMTSDDSKKGGSGGGGGTGGNIGDADGGQWIQKESIWEKYTSSIDTLYELGDYISGVLTDAMNSIRWDDVYESARNFGTGLASFLNGLISPELFGSTGRTIAGALNTAIYAALSFGETFDWEDLGESIASGINNFFSTFDFGALANTIDTWVQGIWRTIKTAFFGDENGEGGIDWSKIWNGAKEFLSEIDLETLTIIVGSIVVKGITKRKFAEGILKTIGTMFTLEKLKFLLSGYTITFSGGPAIDVIGNAIITLIDEFLKNNFGESALNAMGEGLLIAVSTGAGLILGGPIGAAIGAAIGVALDTFVVKGEWITKFWDKISELFFNFDYSNSLLKKAKEILENAFKADNFFEIGANIVKGIGLGIGGTLAVLFEPIYDLFTFLWDKICNVFGIHSPSEKMKPIGKYILLGIAEGFANAISEWIDKIINWGAETLSEFKATIDSFTDVIKGIITFIASTFSNDWSKAWEGIKTTFKGIWDAMPDFVKGPIRTIIGFVNSMIGAVESGINYVIRGMNKLSFDVPDWVPAIGGEKFGFDIGEISLPRIPELAEGGIVNRKTLAMIGEDGSEAVVPLERNTQWISRVAETMSKEFGKYKLNTYVPKPDFSPTSYNLDKLKTTMQMEMDAKMAEYEYGIRQQNELMKQILTELKNKQLIVGDKDIFDANRRETLKFGKRTGHDPYPLYGKAW